MNICERCAREFRTVQELRGHQHVAHFGQGASQPGLQWLQFCFAIVGAVIGGAIGTFPAVFCGYGLISCSLVVGVIGGVGGGLIGDAIHRLLFRRGVHRDDTQPRSASERVAGRSCLSLLGLGFSGLIGSLIFWLVMAAVYA